MAKRKYTKRNTSYWENLSKSRGKTVNKALSNEDILWGTVISSSSANLTTRTAYRNVAAVKSAVDALVRNVASAKIRLFTQDRKEIVGGDLFNTINNPNKFITQYDLKTELLTYYLLTGEIAVWIQNNLSQPTLHVLDPDRLQPNTLDVEHPSEVKQWTYNKRGGGTITINPNDLIYYRALDTDRSVRGLSPLFPLLSQINSVNQAWLFAKRFFENDCSPSKIINLGPNVSPKHMEEFSKKLNTEFNTFKGNSHKTMVLSSSALEVKDMQSELKDILMKDMVGTASDDIFGVLGVPPIIAGNFNKTRFDSASEEISVFFASTIAPIIELVQSIFQAQLVNTRTWRGNVTKNANPRGAFKEAVDKALDDYTNSDVVVCMDPTTLPIWMTIEEKRIDAASKAMKAFWLSPRQTSERFNLDLPENEFSDEVMIDANLVHATTKDEFNEQMNPPQPEPPQPEEQPEESQPEDEPQPDESQQQLNEELLSKEAKAVKAFFYEVRKYCLSTDRITLKGLDELNTENSEVLNGQVRAIYKACKAKTKEEIKEYFNSIPRKFHKQIAHSRIVLKDFPEEKAI